MNEQSWIQRIPKTELTWVFAWVLVFATAINHFFRGVAVDGTWLAFLGGMVGAAVVQHVGNRAATKPGVIIAEAQAKAIEKTGEQPIPVPTPMPFAERRVPPLDQGEK